MEKVILLILTGAALIWAVFRFVRFRLGRRDAIRTVLTTGKPFIVPNSTPEPETPEKPPEIKPNRAHRRRLERQEAEHRKKYAGKLNRDEIRKGKIIEANEFLNQYFNGKKQPPKP